MAHKSEQDSSGTALIRSLVDARILLESMMMEGD
jgi:hypothetical protein